MAEGGGRGGASLRGKAAKRREARLGEAHRGEFARFEDNWKAWMAIRDIFVAASGEALRWADWRHSGLRERFTAPLKPDF